MHGNEDLRFRKRLNASLWDVLLAAFFASQAAYFAVAVNFAAPPDEIFHVSVSRLWAANDSGSIEDGVDTYAFGPIGRWPHVFHRVMGGVLAMTHAARGEDVKATPRSYRLPDKSFDLGRYLRDMLDLRWVNAVAATLGFWVFLRFLRVATKSAAERCVTGFFVATCLMLTFLSGSVNYDNFVIPLAAGLFFMLALLARDRDGTKLVWLIALLALGCIVKVVFLPIAASTFVVALWLVRKDIATRAFWRPVFHGWRGVFGVAVTLVLARENAMLFGANLMRYHKLYPECTEVYPEATCFAHYSQARRNQELAVGAPARPRQERLEWLGNYLQTVELGIVGISSHSSIVPRRSDRLPLELGVTLGILATIVALVRRRGVVRDPVWVGIAVISSFYLAAVAYENRQTYEEFGVFGLGLNGRYWLPVFPALAYLLHRAIFDLAPARFKRLLAGFLLVAYAFQGPRIWWTHRLEREEILGVVKAAK